MPLKEQWTEFDWERELRKDDARIHAYFQELPGVIDLPKEDEIIYGAIRKQKKLAPADGNWDFQTENSDAIPRMEDMDEEERKQLEAEWMNREGTWAYILCCRLARRICALFAAGETGLAPAVGLLGRMMARMMDLIEMEENEYPALRIALSKRFLADTNDLLGLLRQCRIPVTDDLNIGVLTLRNELIALQQNAREK